MTRSTRVICEALAAWVAMRGAPGLEALRVALVNDGLLDVHGRPTAAGQALLEARGP